MTASSGRQGFACANSDQCMQIRLPLFSAWNPDYAFALSEQKICTAGGVHRLTPLIWITLCAP